MVKIADSAEDKKESTKKKTNSKKKPVTGVWPCKINGCNKQFAREADLKRHQRTTKLHSMPGLSVACPQCDATFTRTDALRRHQKSRHNGVIMEPNDVEPRNGNANRAIENVKSPESPSRSRSATPSKGKERTIHPSSNPPPSTHPPASGGYYRHHTSTTTPYMPPRPILDAPYGQIGLPTSATRIGATGAPPPPAAPWNYPPQPHSWPEGPPYLSGPGHPLPYHTYFPPSYYRHPPHPHPQSGDPSPATPPPPPPPRTDPPSRQPSAPPQLNRSRHSSPTDQRPPSRNQNGHKVGGTPVASLQQDKHEHQGQSSPVAALPSPVPPPLLPISTSAVPVPGPPSTATPIIDPLLGSSTSSPVTAPPSSATTNADTAATAVAVATVAVLAAQAQVQSVNGSITGAPTEFIPQEPPVSLEVTQAAMKAVLESTELTVKDNSVEGEALSNPDAIPDPRTPGVTNPLGAQINGAIGEPVTALGAPLADEYATALDERDRALAAMRQEEEEEEEEEDNDKDAVVTVPSVPSAPLSQDAVVPALGMSRPDDNKSMVDVFVISATDEDEKPPEVRTDGPIVGERSNTDEGISSVQDDGSKDADGDTLMDYTGTGPGDTSSASIATMDSERRDEESVEEHLLMDDGEPMLNPADILTSESLASPSPS